MAFATFLWLQFSLAGEAWEVSNHHAMCNNLSAQERPLTISLLSVLRSGLFAGVESRSIADKASYMQQACCDRSVSFEVCVAVVPCPVACCAVPWGASGLCGNAVWAPGPAEPCVDVGSLIGTVLPGRT